MTQKQIYRKASMAKLQFQKSGVAIAFVAYHCSPPENIERKETWYETGEKLKCYLVFRTKKLSHYRPCRPDVVDVI